jgi:enoyl-CoA hydratase/carnithine racemase
MSEAPRELQQFKIEEPTPGYWRVVFSNPPLNLLNSTTVLEIDEVVRRLEEAPNLRVVVFASDHPDFFMARYDLSDTNPVAFAPTASGVTLFIDSTLRMASAPPITIACVRGRTRGGGSEFALACDLGFASVEKAIFGQPEVGVGIVPAGGGIERLAELLGTARALEVIAGSDDFDAPTAERYGWINRALPDDQLDPYVDRLARRLAAFDAQAVATAKRLVRRDASVSLAQLRETLDAVRALLGSPSSRTRRTALAKYAATVGQDFELRMGHYLGSVPRASD